MSEPITTTLRRLLCAKPKGDPCWDAMDAVDAVHSALEAENAALRERVGELDNVGGSMHDGGSITNELRESMEPCISDGWLSQHEDAMAKHGWVRMPKDADGVPIHVGDKVTCARSVWQVTGLRLTGLAWGVCCTIFNDHGGSGTNVYPPCDLRHYHAPTVEDVLREMLCAWEDTLTSEGVDGVIAEYAAKLRLAGSDAE